MWRRIVLVVLVGVLGSCGGGSAGTGTGTTTRTVEGTISDQNGAALVGAEVVLLENGQSTVTDQSGDFSLESEAGSTEVVLEITAQENTSTVTIPDIAAETLTVQVEIKFDTETNNVVLEDIEMLAKIVGACDIYFENNRTIRQANRTPQGVECTAKVWIRSAGQPAAAVPFAVQYRGCNRGDALTTVAVGETRFAPEPGVGQLQFKYFDDPDHCVYRIVAPYGISGQKPIVFEVHSFTKQAADK